jgi:hypothetical protein
MKKAFRKYHRALSLVISLPILLTIVTGMLATIGQEWSLGIEFPNQLLLKIHTGEILHLQAIYPILNGLGLLALLITGLSMSPLFRSTPTKKTSV